VGAKVPCPLGRNSAGNSNIPVIGDVVGVSGPVVPGPAAVKAVTVTELALRVIPLVNGLKFQLVDMQRALGVLPAVQLAIKELREGFLMLDKKCNDLIISQGKTDVSVKVLDQWSLAYDFSKIPSGLVNSPLNGPISVPVVPTMVGVITGGPVVGVIDGVTPDVVAPPLVELFILDLDTMFQ